MTSRKAPGPRGKWLVGDMDRYLADRIGWLRSTQREYGDVVRMSPDTLVVHDPALAHQVLAETNDTYLLETGQLTGRRRRAAAQARVEQWMRVRHGMWHGFAGRLAELHLARLMTDIGQLIERNAGADRDLVDTCRATTGRLIVDFSLGGDPTEVGLCDEAAARADRLFTSAQEVLVQQETRRRFRNRPLASAAISADADLRAFLRDHVARRRSTGYSGTPRDLLDLLLRTGEVEDDDDRIVSVLRMSMFASHGVPGAALSWVVLRLASDPAVLRAVRDEAANCPSDERLNLAHFPFTTAFLQETLRLHPPQWLLTRTAMRRTTIGEYRVDPGQEVLVSPYILHTDERFWPRPERFEPERWMTGQRPHPRHTYLPFGAGPRICPGSRLAMSQLVVLTASLAADWDLRVPPIEDVNVTSNGLLLPVDVRGGWTVSSQVPSTR